MSSSRFHRRGPGKVVAESLAGLEKGQGLCVPGLSYELGTALPRALPRPVVETFERRLARYLRQS